MQSIPKNEMPLTLNLVQKQRWLLLSGNT